MRRSWNAAGTGSLEGGLSAYECAGAGAGRWRALGDAWQTNGQAVVGSTRPWFLIEGTLTGQLGGDDEPLVEDVTFVCVLERDGATDEFVEVEGDAPAPAEHPKVDAAGRCRDWNSIEIAKGEHEVDDEAVDDEAEDEGEEPVSG